MPICWQIWLLVSRVVVSRRMARWMRSRRTGELVQRGAAHAERRADAVAGQILGQVIGQKAVECLGRAARHKAGHVDLTQRPGREGEQVARRPQQLVRGAGKLAVGPVEFLLTNRIPGAELPGALPFGLFVGALHDMAEQQIPHDHTVDLDGRDGLDEAGVAGIDPGGLFLPGLAAGFLVAQAAAHLALGGGAHQTAVVRQLLRVGQNVHPPLVKDDGAQTGQLIKIPQQHQQLPFVKDRTHESFPLFPVL